MIICAPRSQALAAARRYNLQETLAHAIYHRFAAMRGVKALRVATAKPDIYPEPRRRRRNRFRYSQTHARVCAAHLPTVEQNPLRGL